MSADDLCSVVMTAPDGEWITDFVRSLVEDRLCAAAHVFPMRAIYRWDGKLNDVGEFRAECHTRAEMISRIMERVDREHPYEVPGVVVVPLTGGGSEYLNWVRGETT